jgi:hypothetical protein
VDLRPALTLMAILAPAAVAASGGCGQTGNAGTGGAKTTSGKGTTSTGPASSSATGASVGSGAPDAGGPSGSPIWKPLASAPLGCTVNRMVNATQVRAFTWQPCAGVAGCEQTVPAAGLAGASLLHGVVEEEPGQTRVVFSANDAVSYSVYFATQDGWLLDAYQVPSAPAPNCLLYAGAAWGSRYGVLMWAGPDVPGTNGGLLHTFGDPADPVPFQVTAPLGYGPSVGNVPMGATRWAWLITGSAVVSVSNADGGGFALVGAAYEPDAATRILGMDNLTTNGSRFLFDEILQTADGGVTGILATSDGVSPPVPYLVPTDGSFYVFPVYAGAYVAWFRGIGYTGQPNGYQAIEVWASPYSADPAGLAPFKVDDFGAPALNVSIGAAGRAAAALTNTTTAVWDLATKQRTIYTMPSALKLVTYLGLTSQYLWVMAGPGNNTVSTYVRFALQ